MSDTDSTSSAEIPRVERSRDAKLAVDWQHVWFAIARQQWSALAIVPAHDAVSSLATARRLVTAGQAYSATPVHLVDAASVDSASARLAIAEIEQHVKAGNKCVVVVASPITHPAAIAIARVAGAALLVVPLGETEIRVAQQTITCIGRELFVGAICQHHR